MCATTQTDTNLPTKANAGIPPGSGRDNPPLRGVPPITAEHVEGINDFSMADPVW